MRTQLRESHARGGGTTRNVFPFRSDSKLEDKLPPIH
ncbi:hypothetical protein GBAR_LOCUS14609 [Geodia barretti]|uniref:Uncharacterized protein n=1 Tax=Geodia barretti TaxID=519541 RepID=A0AA35S8S1_GEOBA|nr:hypothetical protein GBAR_LOCUS14606 [Geodia barretti]CAI8025259.1 hypothetical protein GBAR_LOCUS14609 [Geodia barretti]